VTSGKLRSIPLTSKQAAALYGQDAGCLQLSDAHEHLIKSAAADEVCLFYGDALIRVSKARLLSMQKQAFLSAMHGALAILGTNRFDDFRVDMPEFGQTFLRVTVTDLAGRSASAIGMLPDPRTN